MSTINEEVASLATEAGIDVARFDTAPASLAQSIRVKLRRLIRVAGKGFGAVAFTLRNREASLYFSLSGGWGLIYEAAIIFCVRVAGAKVKVHHHSFRYLDEPFWPMNLLLAAAGRDTTHIVLGKSMAASLKQRYPSVDHVIVLSNAAFLRENLECSKLRSTLGTVGFLANLTTEKGLFDVLETVEFCNRMGLKIQFVLAGPFGDSILADKFMRRTHEIMNLKYIGPVYGPDKDRFFNEIDALIFPTHYRHEAEPLVVLEALSYGRPVIAFGRGCIPDLIAGSGGFALERSVRFPEAAAKIFVDWLLSPGDFQKACEYSSKRFASLHKESSIAAGELALTF